MMQVIQQFTLNELQERLKKDRFFGNVVVKFEAGEIKQIDLTQKFKPQEFNSLVVVQIAI